MKCDVCMHDNQRLLYKLHTFSGWVLPCGGAVYLQRASIKYFLKYNLQKMKVNGNIKTGVPMSAEKFTASCFCIQI